MATLVGFDEVLERELSTPEKPARDGVTFSSTNHKASTVTIDFARWADMGYPNQIRTVIEPVSRERRPEPVCTCGEGREQVTRFWGNEPHYAGCPRWGTPL